MHEHFVADGLDLSPDIQRHLDDCPECHKVYDELIALADMLAPLERIEMTTEESAKMITALDREIAKAPPGGLAPSGDRRIMSIFRTALAAAAVVVMVLASASFNNKFPSSPTVFEAADDMMLSQVTSDDIATLVDSDETDLWTRMIDDESATYLTEVASAPQIDYVIDDISAEELEWLTENYSMEM
jgi:hypothetical protein